MVQCDVVHCNGMQCVGGRGGGENYIIVLTVGVGTKTIELRCAGGGGGGENRNGLGWWGL